MVKSANPTWDVDGYVQRRPRAQSLVVEVPAVDPREDGGLLSEFWGRGHAHLAEEGPRAGDVEGNLHAVAQGCTHSRVLVWLHGPHWQSSTDVLAAK